MLGEITQRKFLISSDGRPQLSHTKASSNGTPPSSNDESTEREDGSLVSRLEFLMYFSMVEVINKSRSKERIGRPFLP